MKIKERIITIKPKGISQKQYSAFLLELNIMKREWRPYGVDVEIKAPGLRNILITSSRKEISNYYFVNES